MFGLSSTDRTCPLRANIPETARGGTFLAQKGILYMEPPEDMTETLRAMWEKNLPRLIEMEKENLPRLIEMEEICQRVKLTPLGN